jgi:tetratricopeptide (TPR) repeat protein
MSSAMAFSSCCFLAVMVQFTMRGQDATTAGSELSAADQQQLWAAETAYRDKRDTEAAQILRKLVRKYPDDFAIDEMLGSIEAEQGRVQAALPLLQAACKVNAKSAVALANLGAAYLKLHRNSQAVGVLQQALSIDPQNEQTASALGQAYLLTGQPKRAADAFAQAVKAGGANADLFYNWALALYRSGEPLAAGQVLAYIDPAARTPQMESLMGDVAEAEGNYREAFEHLQQAADENPSENNLSALGFELLRHWTFDAAEKVYRYALAKYPDDARMSAGLGIAKFGEGQYPEAATIFSELLKKYPGQPLYAELLGYSCTAIRTNPSENCGVLVNYAEKHQGDTTASVAAATLLIHDSEDTASLRRARKLLTKAIDNNPNSAESYYAMGLLDQREERWGESIPMLEKAVRLRPESSQFHYRLALAYSQEGNEGEAHKEAALQKKFQKQEEHWTDEKMTTIFKFLFKP